MKNVTNEELLHLMELVMQERYPTTESIVKDPLFIEQVRQHLDAILKHKRERGQAPDGCVWRRDWFDKVNGYGADIHHLCLFHIEEIWQKKSPLNSMYRSGIKRVCDQALNEVLLSLCLQRAKEVKESNP